MYELYDPCTVMFFFRNKHIMIDLGTGNNNKINWALDDKQEMIDLIEVIKRIEWDKCILISCFRSSIVVQEKEEV